MLQQLALAGLPECVREYRFHPTRRWRWDLAWPEHRLALELHGGIWSAGRHTRGLGFSNDCVKYSEAAVLGWRVLHATGDHVKSGQAVQWVRTAFTEAAGLEAKTGTDLLQGEGRR
jgi:hypothetical protein